MKLLPGAKIVRLPRSHPPVLVVVIDTEEEFEWGKEFRRDATCVRAIPALGRAQRIFDEFRIRPTYVIDYPVATQATSVEVLRGFLDSGRAVIGAHCHPWVNPPFDEEITPRLTFPGNLDAALERAKIRELASAIEASFGARPVCYKAGRYGLGPNSAAILEEEGFDVDLSVCANVDLGPEGGPDYTDASPDTRLFGRARKLAEIPTTAGFLGWLWPIGPALRRGFGDGRVASVLRRVGALERIRLSPEGVEPRDHRRLTRALVRRGVRVFQFSFHSPSVEPGCTAYVRDEADLSRFLDALRRYFDFFLGELEGVALTPGEVRERLLAQTG